MTNSILKTGYKMTEIGVIPEDWEVAKIKNFAPLQRGFDLPNSQLKEGKYPVVYSNGVMNYHNSFMAKRPGVVTGRSGTIGKVHFINDDYWPHNTSLWVTDFKNNYPLFVFFVYSQLKLERFGTGSGVPTLNRNDVHDYEIPVPPKPEQKAIATVLSDTDELIGSLEALIAKKRRIKEGAMQELLTGKKRLAGFSGEWEMKKIGEMGETITGSTPSTSRKEYWNGNIPWITPTDINDKKDIYSSEREISKQGLTAIRRLPKNSVLVTCIASIGKNAILKKDGACNQQINAVVLNQNNDPNFFYYLMEISKEFLLSNAGMTATKIISKKDFEVLEFKVPTKEEQQAIAQILSDMDSEITALEEKREKYKLVKQGLMQVLLTGKIRLI